MTFTFRPASRENVGLIVGLAGASGSGKTYTALRLATGMAAGKRFAVIDTEAGRSKHYADRFQFDHGDLTPPFTPDRYSEAIKAADDAGYPVIVVDSFSHEWAGEGGCLDWQEQEFERMGRNDRALMASWIKPKMAHKMMVQKLLQCRAHLILCLRAEEKIEMVRNDKGKMEVVPKKGRAGFVGWLPICEKSLPFELTTSILLLPDAPGCPQKLKIEDQHLSYFPPERPVTEEAGAALAAWARGEDVGQGTGITEAHYQVTTPAPDDRITAREAADLEAKCLEVGVPVANLMRAAKVERLGYIAKADFERCLHWVTEAGAKRQLASSDV